MSQYLIRNHLAGCTVQNVEDDGQFIRVDINEGRTQSLELHEK